ncbi:MAG TPA: MoxR family ATPase [Armatimonadetes bacterium]|nr:MoxR family ATPase [Armatimonadota bacterium]
MARAEQYRERYTAVRNEIRKVIVGQEDVIDGVLTSVFAGGHVLLEGVPGLGKTLLVRTLARVLHLKFSRIQFTPDLMPADITGTNIVTESASGGRQFLFQPGPIFANVVLADEINRATPKTQSALLEAMQEQSVSVAREVRRLEDPFFVLATQNPIEQEGTYPLPEAQVDRFFFKLLVGPPSLEELDAIIDRTTGTEEAELRVILDGPALLEMRALCRALPIAPHVKEWALRLVVATHPDSELAPPRVRRFVRYGASPRGAQALVLAAKVRALLEGRYNVSFDDIRRSALPALRHRILLNFEGHAEGVRTDDLVQEIRESLPPAESGEI